jgi:hypothetical protein
MKCSGRRAQKSRDAGARLSNFHEHPRNSGQAAARFLDPRNRYDFNSLGTSFGEPPEIDRRPLGCGITSASL